MTRDPLSPFYNLVQRGLIDEGANLLPWSVMASLVAVFRDLKGGQLFGGRVDYADKWKRNLLSDSEIVSGTTIEEKYEQWRRQSGAWRECFRVFWKSVRTRLGSASSRLATTGQPSLLESLQQGLTDDPHC